MREEYRRLEKRRLEVETTIGLLENRLPLVRKCVACLERDERPSDDVLKTLNLNSKSNLTLLYKALGLRKQIETSLVEKEAELQSLRSNMESFTVCPRCLGLGTISKATKYERMQEGMIVPISSASKCDLCLGSGRLVLTGE